MYKSIKKDLSLLDKRFTQFYCTGERVEVVLKDGYEDYTGHGARTQGRVQRFYVGISSGWKPIFIQLYRKDSIGGPGILSDTVEEIKGLNIFKRGYVFTHNYNHLEKMGYDFNNFVNELE